MRSTSVAPTSACCASRFPTWRAPSPVLRCGERWRRSEPKLTRRLLAFLPAACSRRFLQSEEVAIPAELLVGTCKALFAFIAERVVAFTGRKAVGSLGFTFSFACAQTALDAGTLLGWTKGFALVDGVGSDVVGMLRAALADAGSSLCVAALVNDTVGTLAAARYADAAACVAVILGTGALCMRGGLWQLP